MAGEEERQTRLRIRFTPRTLHLKRPFTLARSSRTTTPVMLVEVEHDGVVGHGEAAMPPYLGESHETASAFLSQIDLRPFHDPFRIDDIITHVDRIAPGNTAAKAAVDIALHDLVGRLIGHPWYRLLGLSRESAPPTSYTIAIDTPEGVRARVCEAAGFKVLKLKMSQTHHLDLARAMRDVSAVPFTADANGGWGDREEALDRIHQLAAMGCTQIEQPFDPARRDDHAWLTDRSPVPVYGDEGVRRLPDVRDAVGVYSGVNVKLMKCAGMREGLQMITTAKALGLRVMIGCMTETSCAVSAAAHLAPLVEGADLDGPLLIKDDPFEGAELVDGVMTPLDAPGIGVRLRP